MSENWHEERDRLVKLLAAIRSGEVTHVDQKDMRELQTTNPVNVAALEARLNQLNARLGSETKVAEREESMATRRPQGRYRTEPAGDRGRMAYVVDGFSASYVTETVYRAKGYQPDFEELPTEDEYDAGGRGPGT